MVSTWTAIIRRSPSDAAVVAQAPARNSRFSALRGPARKARCEGSLGLIQRSLGLRELLLQVMNLLQQGEPLRADRAVHFLFDGFDLVIDVLHGVLGRAHGALFVNTDIRGNLQRTVDFIMMVGRQRLLRRVDAVPAGEEKLEARPAPESHHHWTRNITRSSTVPV